MASIYIELLIYLNRSKKNLNNYTINLVNKILDSYKRFVDRYEIVNAKLKLQFD